MRGYRTLMSDSAQQRINTVLNFGGAFSEVTSPSVSGATHISSGLVESHCQSGICGCEDNLRGGYLVSEFLLRVLHAVTHSL